MTPDARQALVTRLEEVADAYEYDRTSKADSYAFLFRNVAKLLTADGERLTALEQKIGGYEHEQRMMQADLARFVTDCSTPTFQLARNALEALEKAEALLARLREALEALTAKLRVVHDDPNYQAVWGIAQCHAGPYTGPQYVDELAAAEAALQEDR